ncbi:hypothetical protein RRG08_035399 [Elysia crispata]|uniref:Integrin alpha-2 domain-containing protein n=1 Tax=Elysia crispata TaxID=231223 RepID=A0AAE0Y4G7_9GAST|nr:hypothetical protein RRG08_035399 [Elysia crispata]
MSQASDQDQDPGLELEQFWPGGTCGCTSSIHANMDKKALWNTGFSPAERSKTECRRSRSFALEESLAGREKAGGGGYGRGPRMGCASKDSASLFVHELHFHDTKQRVRELSQETQLKQLMVVAVTIVLVLLTPPAVAFNVDLKSAVVHEGPENSMFGYAVAQHIDQSTNWVLIGAPRYQTSQPRVERGGAVFRCKTDSPNSCQEVPFDNTGNNYVNDRGRDVYIEEKSNQWLGSTVQSSGENGVIVACAPRYVYFSDTYDKREPIGMCFLAKTSTTKYERFSPCRRGESNFNNQGYCQAGVSAALSKDGTRLLIGAPGSWYWQGQLFNYDTNDNRNVISKTPEGQPYEDDTYMGYASAVGEFDGNDEYEEYVVGIPKGGNSTGMIEIYAQNMSVIGSMKGEQIGSYYGSAIAVVDLTGDGFDDIIVGAPFFGNVKSDAYESGRVYIYYQTKKRKFKKHKVDILNGPSSQSRFGMALSRLGDINYDGYEDLCVGAPYGGEDKLGAIYLYHGSNEGIITAPTQVIHAKDIAPGLSAFGISISGGWDQDFNEYPDLLVGAYSSDKAVFFRSRPVVKVTASIITSPTKIDLKKEDCNVFGGKDKGPCLSISSCFGYSGHGLPDFLHLDVTWTLDAKDNTTRPAEQRAFFTNGDNVFTMKSTEKILREQTCEVIEAYVKGDIIDKLSPITVMMEFELNQERFMALSGGELQPILDARVPLYTSYTTEIKNDCGDDNICYPDLHVTTIGVTRSHNIGTTSNLEFIIVVENNNEDSYNTKVWITLPPGVVYDTITNSRSPVPISCGRLESDNKMVVCDIGNPMKGNTMAEFTINSTPTNTNDTQDRLVFLLFANSSNIEEKVEDYNDNHYSVEIPVTAVPEISLEAKVSPEYIVLNTTNQQKVKEERSVTHAFQLRNQGTCAINETILQVLWPSHDIKGTALLSLDGDPLVDSNTKCKVDEITPDNVEKYKDRWWKDSSSGINRNGRKGKDEGTSGKKIDCSDTGDYCTVIQCHIGYMKPSSVFDITIKSIFKPLPFLKNHESTDMYEITSVASAKVISVPYDFKAVDKSKFAVVNTDAVTIVHTDKLKPAGKGVKIWVIALAITAGVLLLILLILLLWFCGFFKRKRHEDEGYFMVKNGQSSYIDSKIVD